jgi:hypothetical protein
MNISKSTTRRHFLRNSILTIVAAASFYGISSYLETRSALSVIDILDPKYSCKSLADGLIDPRGVVFNPSNKKVYFTARYRRNCWSGNPTGYRPYELNDSVLRIFAHDLSKDHDPDDYSREADERRKWERHNWPHKCTISSDEYDLLIEKKKPGKVPVGCETVGNPESLIARVKQGFNIDSDDSDDEGNLYIVVNPSGSILDIGFDKYWDGQGKIIKISKK